MNSFILPTSRTERVSEYRSFLTAHQHTKGYFVSSRLLWKEGQKDNELMLHAKENE